MGKSSIEWTDVTWNPTVGCTKVTAGCLHCYAEVMDRRLVARNEGVPFVPWTVTAQQLRLEGATERAVRLHPDRLDQPLHWKKPVRVFVDSMSDLFHEDVPDEFIGRVFATMLLTPQHTYQVLTKRPDRAAAWLNYGGEAAFDAGANWPLPNVWIGVSVTGGKETAGFLDALARIPAAVRFVSYEPALRPFDFWPWLGGLDNGTRICQTSEHNGWEECRNPACADPVIDWLIVGGESGPKARPFNVGWAERVLKQCQAAGVAAFFKQMGAKPFVDGDTTIGSQQWLMRRGELGPVTFTPKPIKLNDSKGGVWDEWPEALRVREFPTADHVVGAGEKVGR